MAITKQLEDSNKRFCAELDAFNRRTQEMKEEFLKDAAERDVRYEKLRVEFKEEINQITNRGIGILGALIVIVGVISTFAHSFFH